MSMPILACPAKSLEVIPKKSLEVVRKFICYAPTEQEEQAKSDRKHEWSNLPRDISTTIGEKLSSLPYIDKFGAACKEWSEVYQTIDQTHKSPMLLLPCGSPMLLLPYNEETKTCTFLELESFNRYDLTIPEFQGLQVCGSNNGWLAVNNNRMEIRLFNPLTRTEIKNPSPVPLVPLVAESELTTRSDYIDRVVLSCDPSSPNCFVAVIFDEFNRLGVSRLSDGHWGVATSNPVSFIDEEYMHFDDVIFSQGKIFATRRHSNLYVFEYGNDLKLIETIPLPTGNGKYGQKWPSRWLSLRRHLVEYCGQILFIRRYGKKDKSKKGACTTLNFEVFRLEQEGHGEERWSKISNLGEESLFLGRNGGVFMISIKEFPWCKSNCIYFTQADSIYEGYQCDNGIYSLKEDRVIEEFDIQHSVEHWSVPAVWYQLKI